MDLAIVHTRLAETVPPNKVDVWGLLVERDRALITALSKGDRTAKTVLLARLAEQHNLMWQTLNAVRR